MKIFVHQLLSLWLLLLTLTISVRSCTEDVSCKFGLVNGQCGWYSLSGNQFKNKWESEGHGNFYMFVDMGGDAQTHVTSLYSSQLICATNVTHSFTFRYSLQNGENCHMTSYVKRSDRRNISLWDSRVFVQSKLYSQLPKALVCPQDTTFQIIIQVTKIHRRGCGEVRIDDVEYKASTRDRRTCTVTPSTSTPGVQGKTSPLVKSADTLSSLSSNSVTTNIATVWSLASEIPQTGTTLSSSSSKSSTDLQKTEKESPSTTAPAVQAKISSGTSPKEVQRGSTAPQDKTMSAGSGVGIGLTVCIIFIVSASVTVIVVRKKCKTTPQKRTMILMNTATSIHKPAGNENPRNAQEIIAPDGDMTIHTELPVHQRATRDDRVTSSDHVITEGDSFQDSSQENYGVLFSKVSGEQTTQYFELDTYSHLQAQSAAGDVSHDNKTSRISELEQSNMSAASKASAPPDTDDDYVALRASLNSHGIASGSDVYDHLKNDMYVNDPTKR